MKCQTMFSDFLQIVSYGDILHKVSNPVFWEKIGDILHEMSNPDFWENKKKTKCRQLKSQESGNG